MNKFQKAIALGVALIALLLGGVAGGLAANAQPVTPNTVSAVRLLPPVIPQENSWSASDGETIINTAIIRLGPDGPRLHTNSAHVAIGVTGVSMNASGDLVVYRQVRPGEKIASCIADEDESISGLRIEAGCSGGSGTSTYKIYDENGNRVRANDARFGETANLWLVWIGFIPTTSPLSIKR